MANTLDSDDEKGQGIPIDVVTKKISAPFEVKRMVSLVNILFKIRRLLNIFREFKAKISPLLEAFKKNLPMKTFYFLPKDHQ